jgi:hypothetical protein
VCASTDLVRHARPDRSDTPRWPGVRGRGRRATRPHRPPSGGRTPHPRRGGHRPRAPRTARSRWSSERHHIHHRSLPSTAVRLGPTMLRGRRRYSQPRCRKTMTSPTSSTAIEPRITKKVNGFCSPGTRRSSRRCSRSSVSGRRMTLPR